MKIIVGIQNSSILHVIKKAIEQHSATTEDVPPEPLDSLVVDASTTYEARPTWSLLQDHEVTHSSILSSSVSPYATGTSKHKCSFYKQLKNCISSVVVGTAHVYNQPAVTIDATMQDKSPPVATNEFRLSINQ